MIPVILDNILCNNDSNAAIGSVLFSISKNTKRVDASDDSILAEIKQQAETIWCVQILGAVSRTLSSFNMYHRHDTSHTGYLPKAVRCPHHD